MDCKIIEDLLPGYVDGICSEETGRAVEEHIKHCRHCQNICRMMQEDIPVEQERKTEKGSAEESFGETKRENMEQIQPFLNIKKIVWRRVFRMLVITVLASAISLILLVLAVSQLHPEWGLPYYKTANMKKNARKTADALAGGDMDSFLESICNPAGMHYSVKRELYEQIKGNMEKIYDDNFRGMDYTVDISCGEYGSLEEDGKNLLGGYHMEETDVECIVAYKNGIKLQFYLSFTDQQCFRVGTIAMYEEEIQGEQGAWSRAAEDVEDLNRQVQYFQSLKERWENSGEVLEHFMQRVPDKDGADLSFYRNMVTSWCGFSVDCMHGNRTEEAAEYSEALAERLYRVQKNITTAQFLMTKTGISPEEKKEMATLTWRFKDSRGEDGILVKDFYFGPYGYEAADGNEMIYGELEAELREQLEQLFDEKIT